MDFIDTNHLRRGSRLPSAPVIAAQLGVSLPTLRQALQILKAAGVVEVRRGSEGGIFTACDVIPLGIVEDQVKAEGDALRKLIIDRHLIEPVSIHLAAERGTEDDFVAIDGAIAMMESGNIDDKRLIAADGAYHRRVAYATHDDFLIGTLLRLYRRLLPAQASQVSELGSASHMVQVHRKQLVAIREKDHAAIDDLIRESFIDLERSLDFDFEYEMRWMRRRDGVGRPSRRGGGARTRRRER